MAIKNPLHVLMKDVGLNSRNKAWKSLVTTYEKDDDPVAAIASDQDTNVIEQADKVRMMNVAVSSRIR